MPNSNQTTRITHFCRKAFEGEERIEIRTMFTKIWILVLGNRFVNVQQKRGVHMSHFLLFVNCTVCVSPQEIIFNHKRYSEMSFLF